MVFDLELKDLDQFIGTEQYHDVMGVTVTDGIMYLIYNGYSWFVTDVISIIRSKDNIPSLKNRDFLSIKLKLYGSRAKIVIGDGITELYSKEYSYTTALRELHLFYLDNVLMLNREY